MQDCRACQARLAAATQNSADDAAKIAALTRERDAAVTVSKGGISGANSDATPSVRRRRRSRLRPQLRGPPLAARHSSPPPAAAFFVPRHGYPSRSLPAGTNTGMIRRYKGPPSSLFTCVLLMNIMLYCSTRGGVAEGWCAPAAGLRSLSKGLPLRDLSCNDKLGVRFVGIPLHSQ